MTGMQISSGPPTPAGPGYGKYGWSHTLYFTAKVQHFGYFLMLSLWGLWQWAIFPKCLTIPSHTVRLHAGLNRAMLKIQFWRVIGVLSLSQASV